MTTLTQSARLYQERKKLIPTRRGPVPRYNTAANDVHEYPLYAPLPWPQFLEPTGVDAETLVWPEGHQQ